MGTVVKVVALLGTALLLLLAYQVAVHEPFPAGALIIALDVVTVAAIIKAAFFL